MFSLVLWSWIVESLFLVLQMGVPSDREQYIHRLGRTGRKGKEGKGILLLAPWEEFFLATLRDLPIVKASLPSIDPDAKKKVSFFYHLNSFSHYYIWELWKRAHVLLSLTNTSCYNGQRRMTRDQYQVAACWLGTM